MRFDYCINKQIPQAAWCAVLSMNSDIVEVEIGTAVPHRPDFFVTGVWDGVFSEGAFDEAHFACCTGGKISRGGVIFATPTHLLETIYAVSCHDRMFLSNSLAFVLKRSNASLDPNYFQYQEDLCSSLFGIKKQICEAPLLNGLKVQFYRCCTIEVNSHLVIQKTNRESGLRFGNYEEYIASVRGVLQRLKDNAVDSFRLKPYGMIATISRGYDAPASAALAKEIGCDKAFTFDSPASYRDDCGDAIAAALGYSEVLKRDADFYRTCKNPTEAENNATGNIAPGTLGAHRKDFADCLIFVGSRGDSLWERMHDNVNPFLDFTDGNTLQQSDHSDIEMCFDVNAVMIPVPLIGADRWPQIAEISRSEEMMMWSVRRRYDRPIARRILEEKGIPRYDFGQIKKGMGRSFHFDTFSRILGKMSPESADSVQSFKRKHKNNSIKRLICAWKFYRTEWPIYANYLLGRFHIPLTIKYKEKYLSSPHSALLIQWGIEEIKKRY